MSSRAPDGGWGHPTWQWPQGLSPSAGCLLRAPALRPLELRGARRGVGGEACQLLPDARSGFAAPGFAACRELLMGGYQLLQERLESLARNTARVNFGMTAWR